MWAVAEALWIMVVVWFVLTQVMVPLASGRPWLPLLRRQAVLEHELNLQRQRNHELSLSQELEQLRKGTK